MSDMSSRQRFTPVSGGTRADYSANGDRASRNNDPGDRRGTHGYTSVVSHTGYRIKARAVSLWLSSGLAILGIVELIRK